MDWFFAVFLVGGILCCGVGIAIFPSAKSAIHEIEALLAFSCGSVLLVGSGILYGIDKIYNYLKKLNK